MFNCTCTPVQVAIHNVIPNGMRWWNKSHKRRILHADFLFLQPNPSYTDSAQQCITAANTFYVNNDFCTNNYRELYDPLSVASFTSAATQICISGQCSNRRPAFTNFLQTCQDLGDDSVKVSLFSYHIAMVSIFHTGYWPRSRISFYTVWIYYLLN